MKEKHVNVSVRRIIDCAALIFAVLALRSPASAQLMQHVSEVYPGMSEALFAAPAPIARELKYHYFHQKVIGGEAQQPVVSTNETATGATRPAVVSIALPAPQTGATMSALYERKQAEARADGNHVMETYYGQMSEHTLQTQAAFDRANAAIGLMQAGVGLAAALGQVANDAAARSIAEWIAGVTGAIGPSAPEGTVLHLGFFESFEAEKLSLESRTELIVTATLETPDQQQVAQAANTMVSFVYRKKNPAAATPRPGFVLLDETLRRAVNEVVKARKTNRMPFAPHYAIVGQATVGALYDQLAASETIADVSLTSE